MDGANGVDEEVPLSNLLREGGGGVDGALERGSCCSGHEECEVLFFCW